MVSLAVIVILVTPILSPIWISDKILVVKVCEIIVSLILIALGVYRIIRFNFD